MPLSTFTCLTDIDPGLGAVVAAIGSNIVVCNTNAQAVNSADPWACLAGTGTNHGNVRPIQVPGRTSFVDFFHVFRAGNATITTELKMKCAGLVPPGTRNVGRGQSDVWPYNVDTNFTDVSQFFVPLTDSTGATEVAFGTAAADLIYSTTWGVKGPRSFYIAGTKLLVPLITQAAAGPTASLVIARFTS